MKGSPVRIRASALGTPARAGVSFERKEADARSGQPMGQPGLGVMLRDTARHCHPLTSGKVASGGSSGAATVYRGHAGIPDGIRDLHDSFAELQIEISEIQQVGDRAVGIGRIRTRGKGSGVESWSAFRAVMEFKNGKATQIRSYLDPQEAVEAAGLRE